MKVHADSSDEGEGGDDEEEEDTEEEEEDEGGELATFEGNVDEVKLVLVVRTDLGMGKGELRWFSFYILLAVYTRMERKLLIGRRD